MGAIEYVKTNHPAELLKKSAAEKLQEVQNCEKNVAEAKQNETQAGLKVQEASDAAKESTQCDWMFGDAANGWFGFHELAHLNPLRWSGVIACKEAIKQLEQLVKHFADKGETQRPIVMKIVSGASVTKMNFETPQAALDCLKEKTKSAEEAINVAQALHEEAKAHVKDTEAKLDEAKMAHEEAEKRAKDAGSYDFHWN